VNLTFFPDAVHQKVIQSIEAAEKAMSTARPDIEKAKASKDDRNQVISKANDVASALLVPSRQVVHLLAGHGSLFPPLKQVGNAFSVRITSLSPYTRSHSHNAGANQA
jgi:hypothetical protein